LKIQNGEKIMVERSKRSSIQVSKETLVLLRRTQAAYVFFKSPSDRPSLDDVITMLANQYLEKIKERGAHP